VNQIPISVESRLRICGPDLTGIIVELKWLPEFL
jgi:hypothetical protein